MNHPNPNPGSTTPWTVLADKRVLITGATSGLGFEAAAQLAALGIGSITITGRTAGKADGAVSALVERTRRDIFDSVVVDVADPASSRDAVRQLRALGHKYDAVVLNAGMVPAELNHTVEGFEECFASTLLGHHLIASSLVGDGGLRPNARVIMVGSEAANGDIPKMMGMTVPIFITSPPATDAEFTTALDVFAHGPERFDPKDQYAGTKALAAMWTGAMARRHDSATFVTVSPGSAMNTQAARHVTGAFKVMVSVMRKVGSRIGMDQTVADAARRYVDVVVGDFPTATGGLYTSRPKKLVGPLAPRDIDYLSDRRTQDLAAAYLDRVTAPTAV